VWRDFEVNINAMVDVKLPPSPESHGLQPESAHAKYVWESKISQRQRRDEEVAFASGNPFPNRPALQFSLCLAQKSILCQRKGEAHYSNPLISRGFKQKSGKWLMYLRGNTMFNSSKT
jgi:hypothetical protein